MIIENKWRYYWNRTNGGSGDRVFYYHCKKKNLKCKASAVLIEYHDDGENKLFLAKWVPEPKGEEEAGEEQDGEEQED